MGGRHRPGARGPCVTEKRVKRGTQGREGVWLALALELPLAGPGVAPCWPWPCPRPARPHPYPRRAPQRCYEGQHAALTWALGVPGLILFAVRPAELQLPSRLGACMLW